MNDRPSSVFIVDDDPAVRKATARLLLAAGFIVSPFASAGEFLESYAPDTPGCLLLDLAMPERDGLELQQALLAAGEPPPIIFMSGCADVSRTVRAMKLGAFDFLVKPVEEGVLIAAVQNAFAHDRAERLARRELAAIRRRFDALTPRELQVLRCVVAGRLNKQTADELGTVEKTIKVHRARVMDKLQVDSLAELVLLAARIGIAPHPEYERPTRSSA